MTRAAMAGSAVLHGAMALLILAAPAAERGRSSRDGMAVEMELVLGSAPAPVPPPLHVAAPERASPSGVPESGPEPVRAAELRPRSVSRIRIAPAPRVEEPVASREAATAPGPAPVPEGRQPAPPRGADEPGPAPTIPVALFDRAALAAAVEAEAPRGIAGETTRGEAVDAPGDAPAVDGLRAITDELREQAQAGRPEAAGVVTYFGDARRRMAGAWAPRTVHLPSRTKAMIQSMQAMNRAALEMMEGRSKRAQRAHEDGRVTPDEWRDAMRDAAQRARAVTSVIVAVVHDATGAVIDVQITRSSGHPEFDREVMAAARETLAAEPAPPMPADPVTGTPAGRVARYRFDVLMTAMPPVPPMVGVTFDESTGYFRVFYPGEINWRLNVVFLGARRGTEIRPQSREEE